MMSNEDFDALKSKILQEYPIRKKMAKQANVKLDDQTIEELQVIIDIQTGV